MKIRVWWVAIPVVVAILISGSSCRSEFERIRMSNDPERMLAKANAYYDNGEYLRAQTLYELVISLYRGRPEAEQLFFRYAYTHYHLRQHNLAAHYFGNFSSTFAYSPLREEADFMKAYSNYQLSPQFRLDQERTRQAIRDFQDFINRYPESPRVAECNRLIDEMRQKLEDKAYHNAELYYNMGMYEGAIQEFENMLRDFPDTERAEKVRYHIVLAAYQFASRSVYERRRERYELTKEKYMDFIRKYPQSTYKDELESIYQDSQDKILKLNQ